MSFDSNHNLEKGPFVYKFVSNSVTQIFNVVVCMAFYGNNIYCYLQTFNFGDQAAYNV